MAFFPRMYQVSFPPIWWGKKAWSVDLINNLTCSLERLSDSYVSRLDDTGPVWDCCPDSAAPLRLERQQTALSRVLLRCSESETPRPDVLEKLFWPTLTWQRRRLKLLLPWQLVSGHGPAALRDSLPSLVSARSSFCFRNSYFLFVTHVFLPILLVLFL